MRRGFLEPDEEPVLNLLSRVLLGKAGAHGPCGREPTPQPAAAAGERRALCIQAEAQSRTEPTPGTDGGSGRSPQMQESTNRRRLL